MRVRGLPMPSAMRDRRQSALDRHHFDVILLPMELHIDAIKRDLVNVVAALGDEELAERWRRVAESSDCV